jgi:hypothetical protein
VIVAVDQALGANNTARFFGAAVGITLDSHSRNAFVVSSRKTALGCESRNRGVRPDSERNCVSNIHPPDGLGYDLAAHVLVSLLAARRNWAALARISRTARQS